jgi:hypothetical protein
LIDKDGASKNDPDDTSCYPNRAYNDNFQHIDTWHTSQVNAGENATSSYSEESPVSNGNGTNGTNGVGGHGSVMFFVCLNRCDIFCTVPGTRRHKTLQGIRLTHGSNGYCYAPIKVGRTLQGTMGI